MTCMFFIESNSILSVKIICTRNLMLSFSAPQKWKFFEWKTDEPSGNSHLSDSHLSDSQLSECSLERIRS